ncbi:MAG: UDP-N-acetyl-D-mannosamine dehydrogenase [Colwellia sp.]
MSFETISVIGLGYIGLPTAAMFAAYGKKVIGVDVNQHVVNTINRGEIHIVEPALDAIVRKAVNDEKLKAVLTPEQADAFLIAVPTPFLPTATDGDVPQPDLKYIQAAAKAIAPVLKKGDLVILESTSPVGATEKLSGWLAEYRTDLTFPETHNEESDIRIAHCPERVLPGHVVRELVENDRVIGGLTTKCSEQAVELYKTFVQGDCVTTNARTAEMAKLTENSCRDVQIAFANELSIICDKLDINVWELISLANRHPRINILEPGPGVGGHCIAVDPWFIVSKSPEEAQLIHTARKVNDAKPIWVINKVKLALADFLQANPNKTVGDIRITCFGLAFKANIDDLRESPSLEIAKKIAEMHTSTVSFVEPNIKVLPSNLSHNAQLIKLDEAAAQTDIAVMLVEHDEFKEDVGFGNNISVVDTKGIWK